MRSGREMPRLAAQSLSALTTSKQARCYASAKSRLAARFCSIQPGIMFAGSSTALISCTSSALKLHGIHEGLPAPASDGGA